MNKYVIMGVQGCGKGTQAKLMCEAFDFVHISVGDMFRWNIQAHTKLAARIKRMVSAGKLVGDHIVNQVVKERLEQHNWNFGFVLDGFPRNVPQAEFLLESCDIDAAILIDVPDELVMERILSRRLCSGCGLDYNLIHHRPEVENVCDVCGGALIQREDDQPDAIRARLGDYHSKTAPIIDIFRAKGLVVPIDGANTPEEVHAEIREKLQLDTPVSAAS